jgi:hypothetical protein
MTLSRIHAPESLGFEWEPHGVTWEDRLSELTDYRKIHGHCNVPSRYSEYPVGLLGLQAKEELCVAPTRKEIAYDSSPYPSIGKPVLRMGGSGLGEPRRRMGRPFERACRISRNSRALQCLQRYSENTNAGEWVKVQRSNYRLHEEGKK